MKKEKKIVFIIFLIILLIGCNVYAHPGRTDSSGCHTCRTNCEKWGLSYGQYHCHNGNSSSNSNKTNNSTTTYIKSNINLINDVISFFERLNDMSYYQDTKLFKMIDDLLYRHRKSDNNDIKLIQNLDTSVLDQIKEIITDKVISIDIAVPYFDNELLGYRDLSQVFNCNDINIYLQNGLSTFPVDFNNENSVVNDGNIYTYLKLKNNGLRDSVVNTREIAMVSQVNRIIKMLPETSTVKFGNRNLSLAEAKKAIQDLFSDNGYTFTIVPGQEVSIEFKVLIIGNAGDVVNSQVLYTMDGLEADPGKLNKIAVEKIVQYNEIAENGANVVMALDNSGSMRNQRKVKAIEAAKIFSDSLLGDNTNPNNKICVVLMPCSVIDDNAVEYICSSSNSEVKNYVSRKLTAIDGCMTPYVSALGAANLRIRDLIKQRPGFDSFVIFLSDGNPEVNSNQQYLNTKDKYTAKANTLKEVASLYTIGFETNYAASSILKGLATGKNDNFYIEGNQYFYEADKSNLQDTFRSIARKINEKSKITSKGVLAISRNIDKTKNLIIEVTDTRGIRKEYIKSYDEAISENYIINKGNRYEINIKKFKPTDKISVTYFLERN